MTFNIIQLNRVMSTENPSLPPESMEKLERLQKRVADSMTAAMGKLREYQVEYPNDLKTRVSNLTETGFFVLGQAAVLPTCFFQQYTQSYPPQCEGHFYHRVGANLQPGAVPSEILQQIFSSKARSLPIAIDCLEATSLSSARALLEVLGESLFNFLHTTYDPRCCFRFHHEQGFFGVHNFLQTESAPLSDPAQIQRSDIVYFKGAPDYLTLEPEGYWGGVNTICVQPGIEPQFDAHGFAHPMTEQDILTLLANATKTPGSKAVGRDPQVLRWNFPKLLALIETMQVDHN